MNRKRYLLLVNILNIIMQFMVSYTLIGIALIYTYMDRSILWISLSLFPVPFVSYAAEKYTKRIWSLLLSHILIFAVYLLIISSVLQVIVYGIYIGLLALFKFSRRMIEEKPEEENTPLGYLTAFVVMSILCNHLGEHEVKLLFFGMALTFVLLHLINMYLLNVLKYMQMYEKTANRSGHHLASTSHLLILSFVSVCMVIMLAFSRISLQGLGRLLIRIISWILRFLFSLFHASPEEPEETQFDYDSPMITDGSGAENVFFQILDTLLKIAVVLGIIAVIFYGLYRIYQMFYRKKKVHESDRVEFISPFDRKSQIKKEGHKNRVIWQRIRFGQTNSEKIRKLFYKAIISHAKPDQITDNLIPEQLTKYALKPQHLLSENTADAKKEWELTALYEKARYGREGCSKEEVQRVKELLR